MTTTVPAGMIDRVDHGDEQVFVDCTTDQIKDSPEFDPSTHEDATDYRESLGEYFARL